MSVTKRIIPVAVFLLLTTVSILNFSCEPNSSITESTTSGGGSSSNGKTQASIITGQVTSSLNGIPIDSAYVQIISSSINVAAITNTLGKFADTLNLSANTYVTVYISKSGFVTDTIGVTINLGTNYSMGEVNISPVSSGGQKPSGSPVSISLLSQTSSNVGVVSSGSVETAGLTFAVLDSTGSPIDLNHTAKVNFYLEAQPNGGEFLSPSYVYTNNSGQATVNLTSGTKAGIVQIRAEIDLANGKVIYSDPAAITIYGGLPDYNHFSLSSSLVNFPDPTGIDVWQVYSNVIKLFVGDKYANPVRPQTAIYLTTTGGYIQGSAFTDNMGTTLADFVVANPFPIDPTLGPGFATITASTADENKNTITRSKVVYFSGDALLTNLTPTTFNVPNGGSQAFSYDVSDKYGNPLASGTKVSVTIEGTNVGSEGDVNVSIPDTQDKAWTHFSFTIYDSNDTLNVSKPCKITVQVTSPNGNPAPQVINGTTN